MFMDPIFFIELGIVGLIIIIQVYVFVRNNQAIGRLEGVYPLENRLKTKSVLLEAGTEQSVLDAQQIDLIEEGKDFSPTFREIVHNTNAYLSKNQGAADFEILKEMAEQKSESMEIALEANITLPLYIGLLCTFTGVIIGLVKISLVGVSDSAIQSFIGGVLIGMVGSASGLALTVRSNYSFKEARKTRDHLQYEYFTFLRTYILPALKKAPPESIASLRENLNAFNEGFAQYQHSVNQSLGESLRLFRELKDVFKQIRSIEQSLSGLNSFLQGNDQLIERQVAYIDTYVNQASAYTQQLERHFANVDQGLKNVVDHQLKSLDSSTQAAYVKMDKYLQDVDNRSARDFVDGVQHDTRRLQGQIAELQQKSVEVNSQIMKHLSKEQGDMSEVNQKLQAILAGETNNFTDSFAFKLFIYAGVVAFLSGIAGSVFYMINHLGI